jgi:hypothetical protein
MARFRLVLAGRDDGERRASDGAAGTYSARVVGVIGQLLTAGSVEKLDVSCMPKICAVPFVPSHRDVLASLRTCTERSLGTMSLSLAC